ncbi:MAG: heavy metal translocating P-type ATPase, partial [Pseudomonadota bacterium]
RRTPDGHFETVPARRLVTGDVILLRAGDRVPADARVIEGEGVVEEAMLTGEPMPATKRAGDPVYAGTINGRSALTLSVENAGDSTALARIIATVEEAQAAKLPIQALINKVTAVFVPIVLLIAVLTFLVWWAFSGDFAFALVAAVSVLIIACPCAMGLATPVSIMVGTGRAAELGVLFRKGDALQSLAKVTLVAFDKTGTLTQGAPSVTEVHTAQGVSKAEALALFASLEQGSAHPIAKALLQESEKHGIPQLEASDIKTSVGRGVMGNISGSKVFVGSTRFLEEQGIAVPRTDAQTATPVHLARDGQYLATALIADPLKPDARAAIDALHARGIKTALVSGDTEATAQAVAAQTGITEVYASVLPSEKAAIVEQLRTKHGQVAFVGDGINDAPALASATVGIALGTGTDVAIEAADVVLMSDDIGAVVIALEASTATLANIRQNLGWAFGYNALLIPVAAGVFYPLAGVLLSPMVAAGAMALSSVFVVSNALRLKRLRPTL